MLPLLLVPLEEWLVLVGRGESGTAAPTRGFSETTVSSIPVGAPTFLRAENFTLR